MNGSRLSANERNAHIIELYQDGFSVSDLAEGYHLSPSRVYEILRQAKVMLRGQPKPEPKPVTVDPEDPKVIVTDEESAKVQQEPMTYGLNSLQVGGSAQGLVLFKAGPSYTQYTDTLDRKANETGIKLIVKNEWLPKPPPKVLRHILMWDD
jgi:hypothetical protein